MKSKAKSEKKINFKKPPLRGIFNTVGESLNMKPKTAAKAFHRGMPKVVDAVHLEIQRIHSTKSEAVRELDEKKANILKLASELNTVAA